MNLVFVEAEKNTRSVAESNMNMKKKAYGIYLTLVMLLSSSMVFAEAVDSSLVNADKFHYFTLLPPIIAIVLAFITKDVVLSLFLGIYSGTFLIELNSHNIGGAFFHGFMSILDKVLGSLADPWNAGIILQCLTIGGLIAVVTKMGGAKAVAETLARKAKNPMSAQIMTWVLGLLVFFDDYANALIVGPIMRPVTDKFKISREKLAFIIDSTAAPVAGIALVSTWIGYEIGLIKSGYAEIGMDVNPYNIFISTIPFRFYNILMLLFIVFTAVLMKEFGPMLKAERRARRGEGLGLTHSTAGESDELSILKPKEGIKLSIWNAIIPIGTLIAASLLGFYYNGYLEIISGEDAALISIIKNSPISFSAIRETFGASDASVVLFQAAFFASIVALLMGVKQRIFKITEGIGTWVEGMKSLVITGVILLLAWSLSDVISDLGTAKFIVSKIGDSVPQFLLPSIIFILGSIISFATGTSYGTMGILMPLAIPLANSVSSDPSYILISVGAVLTGAIFGDHCCPISDTTILSSMGADCDHIEHTKTQLPYALSIGLITILFGYIPAALGFPIFIILPVAVLVTFLMIYFVGKPVEIE